MVQASRDGLYSEGRIVVYRSHFAKLLAYSKPLRDQLLIELPTLEAFRTGEVSSLRVEYVDFERGDLLVLDSKKKRLLPVPLDPVMAEHLAEYIRQERLISGLLIQPLHNAHRRGHKPGSKTLGEGLSEAHIDRIWAKYCALCGIPDMSARMGRAYFATIWHFVQHKSMFNLMNVLRHDDLQSTEHYLCKIVAYEDVRNEFYLGLASPFASNCVHSDKCFVAVEGCHCRMFTARTEPIPQPLPREV